MTRDTARRGLFGLLLLGVVLTLTGCRGTTWSKKEGLPLLALVQAFDHIIGDIVLGVEDCACAEDEAQLFLFSDLGNRLAYRCVYLVTNLLGLLFELLAQLLSEALKGFSPHGFHLCESLQRGFLGLCGLWFLA